MALVLALIAACGGTGEETTTTQDAATSTTQTQTSESTTSTGATAQEPIRIGGVFALSGSGASLGQPVAFGIELAFTQANFEAAGRPIEFVTADSAGNPDTGLQETRRLLDEGLNIWAGWEFSGVALAGIPEVDRSGLPWIVAYASDDSITPMLGERGFRAGTTSSQLVNGTLHLIEEQGWTQAAMIGHEITAFRTIVEAIKERTELGLLQETWVGFDVIDFSPFLAQLPIDDGDVLLALMSANVVQFLDQLDELGIKDRTEVLAMPATVSESLLPEVCDQAEGMFTGIGYAWGIDNPANVAFREAYEGQFGVPPNDGSFYGYVTGLAILNALEAIDGNAEDIEGFVAALEQAEVDSPVGPWRFDENHVQVTPYYSAQVQRIDGVCHVMPLTEFPDVDTYPPAG
jgi:branched-chain amino acid transport system substrate-binding protein